MYDDAQSLVSIGFVCVFSRFVSVAGRTTCCRLLLFVGGCGLLLAILLPQAEKWGQPR
jgi:hypothetical protein